MAEVDPVRTLMNFFSYLTLALPSLRQLNSEGEISD